MFETQKDAEKRDFKVECPRACQHVLKMICLGIQRETSCCLLKLDIFCVPCSATAMVRVLGNGKLLVKCVTVDPQLRLHYTPILCAKDACSLQHMATKFVGQLPRQSEQFSVARVHPNCVLFDRFRACCSIHYCTLWSCLPIHISTLVLLSSVSTFLPTTRVLF